LNFIWATRGRTWGFRFLRDGGFADPLPVYRSAFSEVVDQPEVCRAIGDIVAVRFADPGGRCDDSGRLISHDFVIVGPDVPHVPSVAAGRTLMWPTVAADYDRIWDRERPPRST
jgi:hypothetical protein